MKAVFVGGGALRLLGILRGALAQGVFNDGEINLHDLDVTRSGALGRMLQKTPEYARAGCKVTWGTTLPKALEGADVVGVVLMTGSRRSYELSCWSATGTGSSPRTISRPLVRSWPSRARPFCCPWRGRWRNTAPRRGCSTLPILLPYLAV